MKKPFLAVLLSFAVVIGLSAMLIAADDGPVAKVDEPAPDFTLTAADGETHSLSDFKGKYVVLEWVNYDCPFVHKHYSSGNLPKLQKAYRDKDVVWLAICSSAEGKQGYFEGDALHKRIKEEKAAHTAYLIDEDGKVGKMYQAQTTPHMYVINPDGVLIYAGAIDDKPTTRNSDIEGATNYVVAALEASMNGEDVNTKTKKAYGCSVKYK